MRWLTGGVMVLLMATAAARVVPRLAALELSRRFQSEEALTQAISLDPTQPDFYRQRAELRQNELRVQSYQLAGEDLLRATQLNPYYWRYWNDLARFEERVGDLSASEKAYRKAVDLSPLNGLYRWSLFNFLIRQGRIEEALSELKQALRLDTDLRQAGLDILMGLDLDAAMILKTWPADLHASQALIHDLVRRNPTTDTIATVLFAVFERWLEQLPGDNRAAEQLVSYFSGRGDPEKARRVWIQLGQLRGWEHADFAEGKTFVWNGGFEHGITSRGLDWRIERNPSIRLERVATQGYERGFGLRVQIDGRQRTASDVFLRQTLLVPAGTYLLTCRSRGDRGAARGEFKIVLIETNSGHSSQIVLTTQDSEWRESRQEIAILPGAATELRFSGATAPAGVPATLWVDEVRLTPVLSAETPD